MKVLGIRFCRVSDKARELAQFLGEGLELPAMSDDLGAPREDQNYSGSVFPAGDSWIELWEPGEGMPQGDMLQIVVDDADALAATARKNGLHCEGPMDAHGERIYFIKSPDGLAMSFQSRLDSESPA